MFNERKYQINNEDLKVGDIVAIGCKHYINFGQHSFVLYKKAEIIKISPKRTKITIKNENGLVETLSSIITMLRYTDEVEEYNKEIRLRYEVYKFLIKQNDEINTVYNLQKDLFLIISKMNIEKVNLIYNSIVTLKSNIEETLKEYEQ